MAVQTPLYLSNLGYAAKQDRQLIEDIFARTEQVLVNSDLLVTASGGMNVSTAIGRCLVKGDVGIDSGMYRCYNDAAVVKTMVADGSQPRVNLIVLKVDDAQMVGSGADQGDIVLVPGTPQSGATIGTKWHSSWPPLPNSAIPLAAVLVGAGAVAITAANILDLRPRLTGFSSVAGEESTTSAAYVALATPDRVANIVVAANQLVRVGFQAQVKESVDSAARAALFINGVQLKSFRSTGPQDQAGMFDAANGAGTYSRMHSAPVGIVGDTNAAADTGADVTTGMTLGASPIHAYDVGGVQFGPAPANTGSGGGIIVVENLAAGTYDFEVRYKAFSGTVFAKARRLYVDAR